MAKKYSNTLFLNQASGKVKGTSICSIDTVRGCTNNCVSCFAKKNSRKGELFCQPVEIEEYTGKVHDNLIYRIGNCGDAATNWKNSEKLIKKKKITNNFCVTKLQSIKGFTGLFKRLQVSVDPINPKHFETTLRNVDYILKNFSDTEIILRILSLKCLEEDINERIKLAVTFANTLDLKVIETRWRFIRKDTIKRIKLNLKYYKSVIGYAYYPNYTFGLKGINNRYVCDKNHKKCAGCGLCITLWRNKFNKGGNHAKD